jgi:multidrug efflux system outer membrane protein
MRHVKTASPLLLALLASCSLIPSYLRPALPVSSQYPASADSANTPAAGMAAWDIGWRNFFADPALQGLITLSLANNRNLRIATLDVSQAQAQYRVDRASLFPAINATAGEDAYHTPAGIMGGNANPINYREYSLGVGAVSWELDLFGKIRSQAKAAQETYLSDADTALSVKIALVSEVASAYYTWLADREALKISQDTAAAQEHSLQLTQLAASKGIYTAMDVAEAQTTVDTAQANVAMYTRQVAMDMDELVLLAGASIPSALQQQMNAVSGLDASPKLPDVPAGLPSDLLQRRPDIRAAEHQLLAANANIGAARAAFFPSVTLTASGQTASPGLSNLFGPASGAWLFEPNVSVPIFAAGANFANLDIAKLEKRIEIADYEKTIQSAFHDVSDALNARGTYVAQVQAEQNLVDADTRYYQLADMRFEAGIDNYLGVLVAENSLLIARLNLVSLQLAAQQNSITLYMALGGGWQETSAPAPALP